MNNFLRTTTVINLLILGGLHLPLQAEPPSLPPAHLDVRVGANGLTATSADCTLMLQIAGPAGFHVQQDSEEGSLTWYNPGILVDGLYRYDVYATPKLSRDELKNLKKADLEKIPTTRQSGRFRVEGGHLIVETDPLGPTSGLPGLSTLFAAFWDQLIPSAAAADLTITDISPNLFFDDTSDGGVTDWALQGFNDSGTSNDRWRLADFIDGAPTIPLTIYGGDTNDDSLVVDSEGDLTLANGALFIDRSTGMVNIASTSENCCSLFVTGGSLPEIGIQNILGGAGRWELEAWNDRLIINENNGFGIFGIMNGAPVHSLRIDTTGHIGMGTDTPMEKLHVLNGNLRIEQTGATHAALNFIANGQTWEIKNNEVTGRLTFFSPGGGATTASFKFDRQAVENLLRVGVLGPNTVDINGNLMVTGTITPDYVFTPEYNLESIEAHAAYMWEHKHLPAVRAGQVNAQGKAMVNVGERSQGMLEELEKAHIYIEQLHGEMNTLKSESANKGKQIAALTQEVTANEAQVDALEAEVTALKQKEIQLETLQGEVTALKALVQQLMNQKRGVVPGEKG